MPWFHMSPISGHPMEADFDCSGLGFAAKFAVAGDFDGDGRAEIAIAPDVAGTAGNDFWVMKFDLASGTWVHMSPIPGHRMEADFDCSGLGFAAKFAVTGNFDGARSPVMSLPIDEIAIAPDVAGTAGNDFWVMKFDLASGTWVHMSPIPGHRMEADFDCSGLGFAAKFAVAGDFDGDGRAEIAIAPDVAGTAGNDFWVMKFDLASGTWVHMSPIPGHRMEADFDCSGLGFAAKFAVAGDFDGDGRAEIAIAPDVAGTAGNDFWVMKFDLASGTWVHMSPIPGHRMEADFDCSGLGFAAKFAVAGDFDGDGHAEIAIAPDVAGTAGNDFWVMKFDLASGTWVHMSPIPGHAMEADFDCSAADVAARYAVVGDFDADRRDGIAIAADRPGTEGNDFWAMKWTSGGWVHIDPFGHPFDADFDCSSLNFAGRFAVAGRFEVDARETVAVAPEAPGTEGNDFWVMGFFPGVLAVTFTGTGTLFTSHPRASGPFPSPIGIGLLFSPTRFSPTRFSPRRTAAVTGMSPISTTFTVTLPIGTITNTATVTLDRAGPVTFNPDTRFMSVDIVLRITHSNALAGAPSTLPMTLSTGSSLPAGSLRPGIPATTIPGSAVNTAGAVILVGSGPISGGFPRRRKRRTVYYWDTHTCAVNTRENGDQLLRFHLPGLKERAFQNGGWEGEALSTLIGWPPHGIRFSAQSLPDSEW